MAEITTVSSGVGPLDDLLNRLYIGDNVVWHDESGSLAHLFCLNFIRISKIENKPMIYVCFDRSPKNLLDKLGDLADNPNLTVLDCFTSGKGRNSPIFLKFYKEKPGMACQIIRVENPLETDSFTDILYDVLKFWEGDIRFVFESLTGMQEIWGEEHILSFYANTCAQLYELNTIAYWIMEKQAHSARVKAQINRIAQVAIELSVRRGITALAILKAEKRNLTAQNKPYPYRAKDLNISFDFKKESEGWPDLGTRLKTLRTMRGFSQKAFAKLVGVTSSSISQVESNLIYPSLPALIRMAEILSVEVGSFFQESENINRVIFTSDDAISVKCQELPEESVSVKRMLPFDFKSRAEPYLMDIPPNTKLHSHFFVHKGEEMGYLLSGRLEIRLEGKHYAVETGDTVYLKSHIPKQWKNPGPDVARLIWINVR